MCRAGRMCHMLTVQNARGQIATPRRSKAVSWQGQPSTCAQQAASNTGL